MNTNYKYIVVYSMYLGIFNILFWYLVQLPIWWKFSDLKPPSLHAWPNALQKLLVHIGHGLPNFWCPFLWHRSARSQVAVSVSLDSSLLYQEDSLVSASSSHNCSRSLVVAPFSSNQRRRTLSRHSQLSTSISISSWSGCIFSSDSVTVSLQVHISHLDCYCN